MYGWWRTYNGFMPHCTDRLMIVFHHHSLLCGRFGVFPCHVTFTDCCVGSLALSLGSSTGATKVHFPLTVALTAVQTSNMVQCFFGHATVEELLFESQPNSCSEKPGGSESWFSCKTCQIHPGKQNLEPCQPFFCSCLEGGSCTDLR